MLVVRKTDAFLIGVPKAGTTWLAHTLDQHPEITLSDPKEPNIIASHKGTFIRTDSRPDWNEWENCFQSEGTRLDASIHAFSCPLAPSRIKKEKPNAKFIICLREPVSRSFSHWNMILNTREDEYNGFDWSTFRKAWDDIHLKDDSMYGSSMSRWLKEFELNRFLLINSNDLRNNSLQILKEIETFLEISNFAYDLSSNRHANSAASRRPISVIGKIVRVLFLAFPQIVKRPIVQFLQKRDINIYNFPLLSSKGQNHTIDSEAYVICGKELIKELELFQQLTDFSTVEWIEQIHKQIESIN